MSLFCGYQAHRCLLLENRIVNKNIGSPDRIARLVVGVLLLVLVLFSGLPLLASGLWKGIFSIVGLVLIGTALMRFCPLYRLLGVNSCKV